MSITGKYDAPDESMGMVRDSSGHGRKPPFLGWRTHRRKSAGCHPGLSDRGALMEENRFLLETYADLLSQGVASNLQHVWNSAHTIIIFFDSPPPSGAERYHFRVFRKKDGSTWEKAGEYHYSSRYAPDWKREMLLMGDEGFFIIIRDHQTTIRHFFDFSRSEESFEYRMKE